jgi:hypothetical protein
MIFEAERERKLLFNGKEPVPVKKEPSPSELLGYYHSQKKLPYSPISAFWNVFFKAEYRGKADFLPSFIKMPVAAVTLPLEFVLKNIGAVFLLPLSTIKEKETPSWWLYPLAPLGWFLSQPFLLLGNTLGHVRRTVNAACNLISSATALVGDGLGWIRDKILKREPAKLDYNNRYPGFAGSIKSLIKNGVKLAVNTAVIGIAVFTAGVLPPSVTSIIPKALSAAVTSVSSWISSALIPSGTGGAAAAWTCVGVAFTAASQGLSYVGTKIADACSQLCTKIIVPEKAGSTMDSVARSVSDSRAVSEVQHENSRMEAHPERSVSGQNDSTTTMNNRMKADGQGRMLVTSPNQSGSVTPLVVGLSSLDSSPVGSPPAGLQGVSSSLITKLVLSGPVKADTDSVVIKEEEDDDMSNQPNTVLSRS